jgi:hypothetical protein
MAPFSCDPVLSREKMVVTFPLEEHSKILRRRWGWVVRFIYNKDDTDTVPESQAAISHDVLVYS